MYMKRIFIVLSLSFLFSCSSQVSSEKYAELQKKGNEIAVLTQSVLLANVGQAIQQGGPVYAVEFCNQNASVIVDSLNKINNCIISRITEKNRNQANNLKTSAEKKLWALFAKGSIADTVIQENKKIVYYKPIKILSPACLKCHGMPGSDIDPATSEKLETLYPDDLATGYHLNDFRGIWRIEFVSN